MRARGRGKTAYLYTKHRRAIARRLIYINGRARRGQGPVRGHAARRIPVKVPVTARGERICRDRRAVGPAEGDPGAVDAAGIR